MKGGFQILENIFSQLTTFFLWGMLKRVGKKTVVKNKEKSVMGRRIGYRRKGKRAHVKKGKGCSRFPYRWA